MDKIYRRPILLSKKQLKKIRGGELITVKRNGCLLHVGQKGYSSAKARLKQQIQGLREKLNALNREKSK